MILRRELKPAVFLVALLLTFSSLSLFAQAIKSDDEYKFAISLAQNDFLQEAKYIAENKVSGSDQVLLIARILKITADLTRDTAQKDLLYKQALESLNKFLQEKPTDPKVIDAKFDKGTILQMRGQTRARQIEKEVNPTKRQELLNDAEDILGQSIDLFQDMWKAVKDDDTKEETAANALYYLGRSYYFLGLCHPKGSDERTTALKKADTKFTDYFFEINTTYMQVINVRKYMGHVHEARERWTSAARNYARSRRYLEGIKEERGSLPGALENLFNELTWRAADMYNKGGKPEKTVALCKKWLDTHKLGADPQEWDKFQAAISLEWAKAIFDEEEKIAINRAKKVAATPTLYSGDAIRTLNSWGITDLDPYLIYMQGRSERGAGKNADAIKAFASAIAAVCEQGEENYHKNGLTMLKASREMAGILYNLQDEKRKDFFGAAVILKSAVEWHQSLLRNSTVYNSLDEETKEELKQLAASCANQRYLSLKERAIISKNSIDNQEADKARNYLINLYPEQSANLKYFQARDVRQEAGDLRAAGNYKESVKKYLEAAEVFSTIDPVADYYEKGKLYQAKAVYSAYATQRKLLRSPDAPRDAEAELKKLRDKARQSYESYLDYTKTSKQPKEGSDARRNRASYRAEATYNIGRLYVETAQDSNSQKTRNEYYQKVTVLLKDFDKINRSVPEAIPFAAYFETVALVGLNKVKEAQNRVDFLIKNYGDKEALYLALACNEVAKVTKDRKKKAFYLKKWIQLRPQQPLANYRYAANVYWDLGLELEKEAVADKSKIPQMKEAFGDAYEIYKMLVDKLEKDGDTDPADLFDTKINLGKLSYRMNDWKTVVEILEPIWDEFYPLMLELEKKVESGAYKTATQIEQGKMDLALATKRVSLVATDLAYALFKTNDPEKAQEIYTLLFNRSERTSERWWICKYFVMRLMAQGSEDERNKARSGLKDLLQYYPSLGGDIVIDGKFLPERFKELKDQLGE
ncbi:hypothetical protein ACFL54_02670 [Planctomycetota bacterium]